MKTTKNTSTKRDVKTQIQIFQLLVGDFVKTADTLGERGDGKLRSAFNWDFEKVFRTLWQ